MASKLLHTSVSEVPVAISSRRTTNSQARRPERAPRPVKETDEARASRDIARESAAIYPDTFDTPPSPDEIATEAYCIYCERGQEQGHDIDDWIEAERRLSSRRTSRSDEAQDEQ